ncbi:MAG TPA: hypothetical protein PKY87_12920 [Terricaulis sp.]|nr:hypothetical protein [Terricaulis sp.]
MTAFRTIALAAALSIGFAGAAFARNPTFTATLDAAPAQSRVIAQNTIWNCEGETCVARASHAVSVRACRQLVRQTGARVTAYGTPERQLSADEIARCNGE